jgi:hypothetical protein
MALQMHTPPVGERATAVKSGEVRSTDHALR